MLNQESQFKLQAYLDGELSASESAEVAARLERDPEAKRLLDELRNTREALKAHDVPVALPESREFFWSKIEREISRADTRDQAIEGNPVAAWLGMWRRYLLPLGGALAALVVAALWFGLPQGGGRPHEMAGNGKPASGLTAQQSPARAIEYPADNVEVFTFDDQEEGLSVVWLSYNEHN